MIILAPIFLTSKSIISSLHNKAQQRCSEVKKKKFKTMFCIIIWKKIKHKLNLKAGTVDCNTQIITVRL